MTTVRQHAAPVAAGLNERTRADNEAARVGALSVLDAELNRILAHVEVLSERGNRPERRRLERVRQRLIAEHARLMRLAERKRLELERTAREHGHDAETAAAIQREAAAGLAAILGEGGTAP